MSSEYRQRDRSRSRERENEAAIGGGTGSTPTWAPGVLPSVGGVAAPFAGAGMPRLPVFATAGVVSGAIIRFEPSVEFERKRKLGMKQQERGNLHLPQFSFGLSGLDNAPSESFCCRTSVPSRGWLQPSLIHIFSLGGLPDKPTHVEN
jgi:hypothetical protein